MAYSAFNSLDEIRNKFHIAIHSAGSLFADVEKIKLSPLLEAILAENIQLALNINTEKARSEFIIAPIFVELRRLLNREMSLFSGIDFTVDEKQGLNGFCDFILSKSSDQVFLECPIICVVEAKNENIKSGFAQCSAEMIAAALFNQRNQNNSAIFGIVTTGSNWKFLKLENNCLEIDYDEYMIHQADKILAILINIMR